MIRWPRGYSPGEASFHVARELEVPVAPEVVWPWLVRAKLWPTWYPEFREVDIDGGATDLALGSRFKWKAFRVGLRSEVKEFVPPERLGWSATSRGIDAYHAWMIERLPNGSRVHSEETQKGWVARLNNLLRPESVGKIHQVWLERLLQRARSGVPPPAPSVASRS